MLRVTETNCQLGTLDDLMRQKFLVNLDYSPLDCYVREINFYLIEVTVILGIWTSRLACRLIDILR